VFTARWFRLGGCVIHTQNTDVRFNSYHNWLSNIADVGTLNYSGRLSDTRCLM